MTAAWMCADCGTTSVERVSPCGTCESERIARLNGDPADVEWGRDAVTWQCTACGTDHVQNDSPCSDCGNGSFQPVQPAGRRQEATTPDTADLQETMDERLRKVGVLAGWGFGLLAIVNLLGAIILYEPVPALLFFTAATVSMPPIRREIQRTFDTDLWVVTSGLLYALTTVVGNYVVLANARWVV